jgi:hypothetical protein
MDGGQSTHNGWSKGDSDTIGYEPHPPTFEELVTAVQNLFNPRTGHYFTREEATKVLTLRNYVHY